jgi:hypothetical protein
MESLVLPIKKAKILGCVVPVIFIGGLLVPDRGLKAVCFALFAGMYLYLLVRSSGLLAFLCQTGHALEALFHIFFSDYGLEEPSPRRFRPSPQDVQFWFAITLILFGAEIMVDLSSRYATASLAAFFVCRLGVAERRIEDLRAACIQHFTTAAHWVS